MKVDAPRSSPPPLQPSASEPRQGEDGEQMRWGWHNAWGGYEGGNGDMTDKRRQDRNNREQKRSQRISDQIKELKGILEQSGVSTSKGNKYSVLTSAADFIVDLRMQNEALAHDKRNLESAALEAAAKAEVVEAQAQASRKSHRGERGTNRGSGRRSSSKGSSSNGSDKGSSNGSSSPEESNAESNGSDHGSSVCGSSSGSASGGKKGNGNRAVLVGGSCYGSGSGSASGSVNGGSVNGGSVTGGSSENGSEGAGRGDHDSFDGYDVDEYGDGNGSASGESGDSGDGSNGKSQRSKKRPRGHVRVGGKDKSSSSDEDLKRRINFRRVFMDQAVPMAIASLDGKLMDCNWRFESASGLSRRELLRTTVFSLETSGPSAKDMPAVVTKLIKDSRQQGSLQVVVKVGKPKGPGGEANVREQFMMLSTVHDEGAAKGASPDPYTKGMPSDPKFMTCSILLPPSMESA